jgi:hypothetical protein
VRHGGIAARRRFNLATVLSPIAGNVDAPSRRRQWFRGKELVGGGNAASGIGPYMTSAIDPPDSANIGIFNRLARAANRALRSRHCERDCWRVKPTFSHAPRHEPSPHVRHAPSHERVRACRVSVVRCFFVMARLMVLRGLAMVPEPHDRDAQTLSYGVMPPSWT